MTPIFTESLREYTVFRGVTNGCSLVQLFVVTGEGHNTTTGPGQEREN